jgi:hypothetical protein
MTVSLLQNNTTSSSSLTYLEEESVIDLAEPESLRFLLELYGVACFGENPFPPFIGE